MKSKKSLTSSMIKPHIFCVCHYSLSLIIQWFSFPERGNIDSKELRKSKLFIGDFVVILLKLVNDST